MAEALIRPLTVFQGVFFMSKRVFNPSFRAFNILPGLLALIKQIAVLLTAVDFPVAVLL
jgi:hypothetical protein